MSNLEKYKNDIQQAIEYRICAVTGEKVKLNFDNSFGLVVESLLEEIYSLRQEIEELRSIIKDNID